MRTCEHLVTQTDPSAQPEPKTPASPLAVGRKRKRQDSTTARGSWRAVALDNDETTGAWAQASLVYGLWCQLVGSKPPVSVFVTKYLARHGARPGLAHLLQELAEMKTSGSIDEVVIFTAASDADGWVSFIKDCMEEFASVPGLFGRVLDRQFASGRAADGRAIKDLSLVSPNPENVVLLDDKPQNAGNGYVIGVSEYHALVPMNALWSALEDQIHNPQLVLKLRCFLQHMTLRWWHRISSLSKSRLKSRNNNIKHPDQTLEQAIPAIKQLFSHTQQDLRASGSSQSGSRRCLSAAGADLGGLCNKPSEIEV